MRLKKEPEAQKYKDGNINCNSFNNFYKTLFKWIFRGNIIDLNKLKIYNIPTSIQTIVNLLNNSVVTLTKYIDKCRKKY